jgi:hypothetical protein
MSTEVGTLLGVMLGAVLAGAFQVFQAERQRRWVKQDVRAAHEREHEDRIFDFRRIAYTEFLGRLQKDRAWMGNDKLTWLQQNRQESALPDREEAELRADKLTECAERVGVYGSELAYAVAMEAEEALRRYMSKRRVWATDRDGRLVPSQVLTHEVFRDERELDRLSEEFRKIARTDLRIAPANGSNDDAHSILASRLPLP